MNRITDFINNNKLYLIGLLGILTVFSVVLGLYCNTTTQLNDGWLEIYSHSLLNGGMLYKDCNFPLLPFPVFLFTLINRIFGEKLIVGHIAGAIMKLGIIGVFYTVLFRFFGARNAFFGSLITGAVFISIIYDCCVFSYNDLMYFLSLIVSLLLIKIAYNMQNNRKYFIHSAILGIILAIMLISKQTHGIIITFAALVLHSFASAKYEGIKKIFKNLIPVLIPIIFIIGSLWFYLYKTDTLNDFYINIFEGISSKGNIKELLFHHFKVLGDTSIIWVIYLTGIIIIGIISATKNINGFFEFHNNKNDKPIIIFISTIFSLFAVISLYLIIKQFGFDIFNMQIFYQIDKVMKQICAVGFIITDIMCFYMFFDFCFNKNFSKNNFLFFIFISMLFAMNYSIMLSKPLTNLIFLSIGTVSAWVLQQETPLYKIKNFCIYLLIILIFCLGIMLKIICPACWHCWEASSLISEKKSVENVPFLEGMKLAKEEAEFFSEIKTISDKYTTKNDKIYCLINNQIFYRLLDREPVTKNVNLYFDLCSDEKAISDMQEIIKNPPKLIIWLKMPQSIITLHEYLFRNGENSGQSQLNQIIGNMMYQKKYIPVKKYLNKYSDFIYNYEKFVKQKEDKEKLLILNKLIKEKELKIKNEKSYEKIYKYKIEIKNLNTEKTNIGIKYKKILDIENYRYFLPAGYELYVLIRSDLIPKEKDKTK